MISTKTLAIACSLFSLQFVPTTIFAAPQATLPKSRLAPANPGTQKSKTSRSRDDDDSNKALNRLAAMAEIFLGLGMIGLGTGAITLKACDKATRCSSCTCMKAKATTLQAGSASIEASKLDLTPELHSVAEIHTDLTTLAGGLKMAEQAGVMEPVGVAGESYWDPLGLARDADLKQFRQLRAAELKHGRICMLASLGLVVQGTGVRFNFSYPYQPLDEWSLQSAKSGIAAISEYGPQSAGFGLVVLVASFFELALWRQEDSRSPGDFGDPFCFATTLFGSPEKEPKVARIFENQELAHARLGMIAFLGIILAEYASGYNAVEQWQHAGEAWARTADILGAHQYQSEIPWGKEL
jgi:hypothetical protein